MIELIKRDFVPVALKAGEVNNPPDSPLGRLYRQLRGSMPAPQGIGVATANGEALAWALSFDSAEDIRGFFVRQRERNEARPAAVGKPLAVERYRSFPSQRRPDGQVDPRRIPPLADLAKGEPAATVPAHFECKLIGRALDADGDPIEQTRKQEFYVEDRLFIAPELQRQLAATAERAKGEAFRMPARLAREIVGVAFLGMLDVAPLGGASVGGVVLRNEIELWCREISKSDAGETVLQIVGTSHNAGQQDGSGRDTRRWTNETELEWQGSIQLDGDRFNDVRLMARGHEALSWRGAPGQRDSGHQELTQLPAGRPASFEGEVVFGLVSARETDH